MRELREMVLRHAGQAIQPTAIPGLTLYRSNGVRSATVPLTYSPMVCVMAQGEKEVILGDRIFRYTPADYLLTSMDLPVRGAVLRAGEGRPYLSVSLELDSAVLSELLAGKRPSAGDGPSSCALAIGRLDASLLDCFVRLLRLLDTPQDIEYLAPLVKREIYYRMLGGQHGSMLQQACGEYGRAAGIAKAIRWIRDHFREPFSAERLAKCVHMSPASLNRHFRAVTAMSPLQYQKQIRLLEARRLLVTEDEDAATAAFKVGYTSASQFSREYARVFGSPPIKDAARLHRSPEQAAVR
jgi:AraC-like DNA-binding protein